MKSRSVFLVLFMLGSLASLAFAGTDVLQRPASYVFGTTNSFTSGNNSSFLIGSSTRTDIDLLDYGNKVGAITFSGSSNSWTVPSKLRLDGYGVHFSAGGEERLYLDSKGTLHYSDSEVATVHDLKFIQQYLLTTRDLEGIKLDCMLAGAAGMIFAASILVMLDKLRIALAARKYAAYQAKQPKPTGGPFRTTKDV